MKSPIHKLQTSVKRLFVIPKPDDSPKGMRKYLDKVVRLPAVAVGIEEIDLDQSALLQHPRQAEEAGPPEGFERGAGADVEILDADVELLDLTSVAKPVRASLTLVDQIKLRDRGAEEQR